MVDCEKNVSIAQYTHYKIGGVAREVYFPTNATEFYELLQAFRKNSTEYYILGGGTNVLVGDSYWDGAVIMTADMNHSKIHPGHIVCGAGKPTSRVAEIAREHAKTGLEFLHLLPGSVGGAIAGNARYDNKNISDVVKSLTAVHPENGIKTFQAKEIDFDYKYNSIAKSGWYICEALLRWEDGDLTSIKRYMDAIEKARNQSHQFDFPSCGCIFKNDHKNNIQAGRLIDSLGFKGLTVGGARVAPFHANFIINTGSATACDIYSQNQFLWPETS